MSLDRTEDVELVDAPTTLALSKIWRRQYEGLTNLIFKLDRDRIKAVQYPDSKLGSLPNGELTDVNGVYNFNRNSPIRFNFYSNYGSVWDETRMDEWPSDLRTYIKFSTLRKAVVTFNRSANPEWNHEKAEKRLSEYNKLKEAVAGNEHITMPEIQLPPKAPTMPFTVKANELIQTFMNEVYDFEAKEYRRGAPFTVVKLNKRGTGGNKRRILISVDEVLEATEDKKDKEPETDWFLADAEQMVDISNLYNELQQIEEFYDAPSVYASMMHHISHLEKFHEKDDEDDDPQAISWAD